MWDKTKKLLPVFLSAACLVGFLHQENELTQYLRSNWATPEDYIISKFLDHDIVFVGEAHHVKHDVQLIHDLIPLLYRMGVYNLGIEYGCYEYQDKVDALVTADSYDEDLARWLVFKWGSYWPYKEYIDLHKTVWKLNKSLSDGSPKFRVINLDYRVNWTLITEDTPESRLRKVFYKGERDKHMAKVILNEIVKKNQKALIYAGQQHAATRFYHPRYDFEKKEFLHFNKNVMGNLVYRKMPGKVFNICLHYPWPSLNSLEEFNFPVGGMIDRIMEEFEDKRVGFDVRNTPFEKLQDDLTFYSGGRKTFELGDFCDGYVYQKPIADYEGCTVDPLFVTEDNFKEAVDYLPNARLKKQMKSVQQFLTYMRLKVNMKRKFGKLK
jgi:hypothetical protein